MRAGFLVGVGVVVGVGVCGCAGSIRLNAPECTSGPTRHEPTKVDLEPIATRPGATIATQVSFAAPGPADVMTTAIKAELSTRALQGGEPGGYVVHCTLDRFAVRVYAGFLTVSVNTTLYADLSCEAERAYDHVAVWRGALRGRAAAHGGAFFSSATAIVQRLSDRMMSDASRELASDLASRGLGLTSSPSARVFDNEQAHLDFAGTDDTALGPVVLAENPTLVRAMLPSLQDPEAATRATAWNAVGMAAGPDDPWLVDENPNLDDDANVRFYQYKALARRGSLWALDQLRAAASREDDRWLSEFVEDALSTSGLGLPRATVDAPSRDRTGVATEQR